MFNNDFIANVLVSLSVKEFWKSVSIWWSYRQEHSGFLFYRTTQLCYRGLGSHNSLSVHPSICPSVRHMRALWL